MKHILLFFLFQTLFFCLNGDYEAFLVKLCAKLFLFIITIVMPSPCASHLGGALEYGINGVYAYSY